MNRSFLFAPASNDRILSKAFTAGADAVVLDLEDSVASSDKVRARQSAAEAVALEARKAPCELHVRINRVGSEFSEADIRAVVQPGLAALRLPKCESAEPIVGVDRLLSQLEASHDLPLGTLSLYPTIESAAGVLRAGELARASARVAALVFGPSDFLGDLGLPVDDHGHEATRTARSMIVLESSAAGIGKPIDGAFPDLGDPTSLRQLTEWARDLGFFGRSAIHPTQLPVIHGVFTPSDEQIERARRVVAAVTDHNATGVVDGGFVDAAIVSQARATLELAERFSTRGTHR